MNDEPFKIFRDSLTWLSDLKAMELPIAIELQ
jgi:hypothetical protein